MQTTFAWFGFVFSVNWLDHSRTFREQGVDENETLLLRRKFFYSDQNVDSRDPVQLNLLYVQVNFTWSEVLKYKITSVLGYVVMLQDRM